MSFNKTLNICFLLHVQQTNKTKHSLSFCMQTWLRPLKKAFNLARQDIFCLDVSPCPCCTPPATKLHHELKKNYFGESYSGKWALRSCVCGPILYSGRSKIAAVKWRLVCQFVELSASLSTCWLGSLPSELALAVWMTRDSNSQNLKKSCFFLVVKIIALSM